MSSRSNVVFVVE